MKRIVRALLWIMAVATALAAVIVILALFFPNRVVHTALSFVTTRSAFQIHIGPISGRPWSGYSVKEVSVALPAMKIHAKSLGVSPAWTALLNHEIRVERFVADGVSVVISSAPAKTQEKVDAGPSKWTFRIEKF